MARSDARMKLLDAALIAALTDGADVFGGDFQRWCRVNQIPRSTAYRHRQRVIETGRWTARSTRPLTRPPHATPLEVEGEVVRLRRELAGQPGQDCGADNVRYWLQQLADLDGWAGRGWRVPSRATVHNILKRHGLIRAEPKKKPKSSYRRFAYARPRDCYQIDATRTALADGSTVVVFEVLDDCTRLLVATLAWDAENAAGAVTVIRRAFRTFGVPALVLSDNGAAFASRSHHEGVRSRFTQAVTSVGARLIHSSPYHPQTCGKVERHHRTFKAWLARQPIPRTLTELQNHCDQYQDWYNNRRRHSTWNKPPHQAWTDAPTHGGPDRLPVQRDAEVRHLHVAPNGTLAIGNTLISLNRRNAKVRVTVLIDGDHVTIYHPNGRPLGHLTLDHTEGRHRQQLRPTA